MRPLDYEKPPLRTGSAARLVGMIVFLAAALPPVFAWMTLYSAALQVVLLRGHWPSYNRPDPKLMLRSLAFEAIAPIALTAAVGVMMFVLIKWYVPPARWLSAAAAICVLSWVFGCACCVLDPWGLVSWALD